MEMEIGGGGFASVVLPNLSNYSTPYVVVVDPPRIALANVS